MQSGQSHAHTHIITMGWSDKLLVQVWKNYWDPEYCEIRDFNSRCWSIQATNTFKDLFSLPPAYQKNHLVLNEPASPLCSSSETLLLAPPSEAKWVTTQGRAFSVEPLKLWNSLPKETSPSPSVVVQIFYIYLILKAVLVLKYFNVCHPEGPSWV